MDRPDAMKRQASEEKGLPTVVPPLGGLPSGAIATVAQCMRKGVGIVRGNGKLNGIKGTGVGTAGLVAVVQGHMESGFDWSVWAPQNNKWTNVGKRKVQPARILAHELAHLALGCEGKLLSGIKVPLDKRERLFEAPAGGAALARWEAEIKALAKDFTKSPVKGTFRGIPYEELLGGFDDLGEYDAILDWENPIAIELGDLPRFAHR